MGEGGGSAAWALSFSIVGWATFLGALLFVRQPAFFLVLAALLAIVAFLAALRAKGEGASQAGPRILFGASAASVIAGLVLASGILIVLALLALLLVGMMGVGSTATPTAPVSSNQDTDSCCCCDDCCGGCGCDSCCACGDCGCGDCGCGGCGCAAIALPPILAMARGASATPMLAKLAHHPDTPAYDQDVYRVGRHRFCVGCFTVYPIFMVLSGFLAFVPPSSWAAAVTMGGLLASVQGISSAGWAKRRWAKVVVKTALGAGLASLVAGVIVAPWPPVSKVALLAATLALLALSAVPRTKRMRRASGGCSCAAAGRAAR